MDLAMSGSFVFADGRFSPCPLPRVVMDVETLDADGYEEYSLCRYVGLTDASFGYSLSKKADGSAWLVEVRLADVPCVIRCYTWPDLLALLAQLAIGITPFTVPPHFFERANALVADVAFERSEAAEAQSQAI